MIIEREKTDNNTGRSWCDGYRSRKMDTRVQILDEDACILHSANTFGKGINLTILLPGMDK